MDAEGRAQAREWLAGISEDGPDAFIRSTATKDLAINVLQMLAYLHEEVEDLRKGDEAATVAK